MSLEPPGAEGTVLLMHTNNSNWFTKDYYSKDIPGISRTEILSLTGKEDDNTFNTSWAQKFNIMAIECDLIPCVHTYKAEVNEGVALETLLETTEMTQSNESSYPMNTTDAFVAIPMPCLINGISYNAFAFPTHPNETHNHPVPNLLPSEEDDSNTATTGFFVPVECVFSFGAIANLVEYLPTFLEGHVDLYEAIPCVAMASPPIVVRPQ
ncbi:putative zinc-binding oxidoreductase protein [Lasiodiplodia theobromae]|nr:putative zinc-binding oxidoreductase protein [Lasiodiplodia theobromae]